MDPWFKRTEFWMSAATAVLGTLVTCGVFAEGSTAIRVAGAAMAVLASFGYTYTRGMVKSSGNADTASDARQRIPPPLPPPPGGP